MQLTTVSAGILFFLTDKEGIHLKKKRKKDLPFTKKKSLPFTWPQSRFWPVPIEPSLKENQPPQTVFTTATLGYQSFSRESLLNSNPEVFYPSPTLSASSLDPSHNQSQYWGGGSNVGASPIPASSIPTSYPTHNSLYPQPSDFISSRALPTPPNTGIDSDSLKHSGSVTRGDFLTEADSLSPSYSMNATSDPASIAARRHHSSLPAFQFPNNRGGFSSLGSVLSPPTVSSGDNSNSQNSVGNSASSSLTAASGAFASTQNYWTAPSTNPATYAYGSAPNAPASQYSSTSGLNHSTNLPFRTPYSPTGINSLNRANSRPSSPTASTLVSPPAYESSAQFTASANLPPVGQFGVQSYTGNYSVGAGSSASSINPHSQGPPDLYTAHSPLPPPTSSHSYYSQSPSHYSNSPTASHSLSTSSSQQAASASRALASPPYPHHPPIHPAPSHPGMQRYQLAHMGSMPVHYPGMMGIHPGIPQQERPFKCDQCPQSFNRNHDLKRHKRIHLAVKPFPCEHCDKSFSRKDALKVIVLLSWLMSGNVNVTCITEASIS